MGLDGAELILDLEQVYGIRFPDELPDIRTVQDLSETVCALTQEQKGNTVDRQVLLKEVITIVGRNSSRLIRRTISAETRLQDVLSL